MYLIISNICFFSFIISSLFGRYMGYLGVSYFTSFSLILANLVSFIIGYEIIINNNVCFIYLFNWINIELFNIPFTLYFDTLTSLMLIVITSISFCAHFYSISYMNGDPHQSRFMSYLSFFTWFMIILVTSNNFLQLFLGWEGVGICSFLLINFWFTRLQANKSAIKAMLTNKVSDIFLIISIFVVFFQFKSLNYELIFCVLNNNQYKLNLICLFLLIGAVGKSAQIFLHIWLPDAMEGPTPVSSLIHAATMVTAGIFLIIRCSYLFEYSSTNLFLIILFGALTAFFASTTGFYQNDIKKVIAYSTCSQLGYMFFICGFSYYDISFFHLFNHAFFKALLFLTVGCLIHSVNNEQDIRNMGGFIKLFPFMYMCLLIGSISLMGFPFMTGFYSKDLIIEISYSNYIYNNFVLLNIIHALFWLLVISIIFTALYSLRIIIMVFFKKFSGKINYLQFIHFPNLFMIIPLIYLSVLSIIFGFFSKDLISGLGTYIWDLSIYNLFYFMDYEFYISSYKIIPLIFGLYSVLISFLIYNILEYLFEYIKLCKIYYKIFIFFNQKWLFDKIINDYLLKLIFKVAFKYFLKLFDKGILEFIGPYGFKCFIKYLAYLVYRIQSGLIYHYIGLILNLFSYLLLLYFLIIIML